MSILILTTYLTEGVIVTAAVMAILVSVSRDPVDDFLFLTPLTLLLSITADMLRGGWNTVVLTENKRHTLFTKSASSKWVPFRAF